MTPAALARLAPQIRGVAASGETRVDADLIAQLPVAIALLSIGYRRVIN